MKPYPGAACSACVAGGFLSPQGFSQVIKLRLTSALFLAGYSQIRDLVWKAPDEPVPVKLTIASDSYQAPKITSKQLPRKAVGEGIKNRGDDYVMWIRKL